MLVCLLHAPRGPFYSPEAARSRWSILGRQFLPSVGWHTGQSGAPPDIPCSLSGADHLPKLAQPTVEDLEPLAHRTLSGAHRTVWCPHQTVGSATHHARIERPTVGSPDSSVHHRTVRWILAVSRPMNYREWPVDQKPAWRTRHCPVHPDCAESWLLQPSLFPFVFSLILALRQIC
jgi:hypothetical protein